MLNIDELKPKIIEYLLPLQPDKIILFGSYAYGMPNADSDIDIFLIKDDLNAEDTRAYELAAMRKLIPLQLNFETNGIDVLSASTKLISDRKDYFYRVDILENGKVWYERNVG